MISSSGGGGGGGNGEGGWWWSKHSCHKSNDAECIFQLLSSLSFVLIFILAY